MYRTSLVIVSLALIAHATVSSAESLDECWAEKYKNCSAFRTSRTIEEHTPIIDNHMFGFTRSKGRWKIVVAYGPQETCAKVSLNLDMGPLDVDRRYDHVFNRGGGVISDSGSFMHRMGDVESGLRVVNLSCRVPDPESQKIDAEAQDRRALEEEREHLALEEEREHLALEEERERLALEEERRTEEELRLAQARRARDEERQRQRLDEERRRWEEQWAALEQAAAERRARERLAELQRERARESLEEQQRAQRRASSLHAVVPAF